MRNTVLYIAMSLDGYVADINGNVSWLSGDDSDPEAVGSYPDFYESIDTIIMGWRTYYQIKTELSPDEWPYKGKQSYVITHRESENQPGICFYHGELAELIKVLKKETGKNIWICGGAEIAQQLIKADLIDRFCFSVIPTILGSGVKLLPTLQSEEKLKLIKTESYNGIVDLVYERR